MRMRRRNISHGPAPFTHIGHSGTFLADRFLHFLSFAQMKDTPTKTKLYFSPNLTQGIRQKDLLVSLIYERGYALSFEITVSAETAFFSLGMYSKPQKVPYTFTIYSFSRSYPLKNVCSGTLALNSIPSDFSGCA